MTAGVLPESPAREIVVIAHRTTFDSKNNNDNNNNVSDGEEMYVSRVHLTRCNKIEDDRADNARVICTSTMHARIVSKTCDLCKTNRTVAAATAQYNVCVCVCNMFMRFPRNIVS